MGSEWRRHLHTSDPRIHTNQVPCRRWPTRPNKQAKMPQPITIAAATPKLELGESNSTTAPYTPLSENFRLFRSKPGLRNKERVAWLHRDVLGNVAIFQEIVQTNIVCSRTIRLLANNYR